MTPKIRWIPADGSRRQDTPVASFDHDGDRYSVVALPDRPPILLRFDGQHFVATGWEKEREPSISRCFLRMRNERQRYRNRRRTWTQG